MSHDDPCVVAVDVGATTIKGARVGLDGGSRAEVTVNTGRGPAAVAAVIGVCQELRDESCVAIALASAGLVDVDAGLVRHSVNIGWTSLPLRRLVADALELPVTLVHDVGAACLAEATVGLGRSVSDLLVVVIGTGVAAGIVTGGLTVVGATGSAGELGHLVVRADGDACACGQHGCLEVYASAGGIARRHARLGGDSSLTVAEISRAQTSAAQAVWDDAVRCLGTGLAAATVLLDPSLIVLAGGMSAAGERLTVPVRRALADGLGWRSAPPVEVSPLGAAGGRIGAAMAAWTAAGRGDVPPTWTVAQLLGTAR